MSRPHIKAVYVPSAKPFILPSSGQIRNSGPEVEYYYSFLQSLKAIHSPALTLIENIDLEVKNAVSVPLIHPGSDPDSAEIAGFFLVSKSYPVALEG